MSSNGNEKAPRADVYAQAELAGKLFRQRDLTAAGVRMARAVIKFFPSDQAAPQYVNKRGQKKEKTTRSMAARTLALYDAFSEDERIELADEIEAGYQAARRVLSRAFFWLQREAAAKSAT